MVIVLLPVTSAFVFIRMYHKSFVAKSREWEDCKSQICLSLTIDFSERKNLRTSDTSLIAWVRSNTPTTSGECDTGRLTSYKLGLIVVSVCVIQVEKFGLGAHQWNVSLESYKLWAEVKHLACICHSSSY